MEKDVIQLSLHENYVSHWTVNDALRELFQNSYDRETENNHAVSSLDVYTDHATNVTIVIKNDDSQLTRDNLLLGMTSKDDNKDTIGQFGEGFKLALLVLTRLGYHTKVFTGEEVWTPVFMHSASFNTKVLAIEAEESEFTDTTSFWVTMPKEDWLEYKQYNLRLNEDLDCYEASQCTVLFDKQYRSKIFVGGLYVCKATSNLAYGYDFKPSVFPLGRDRKAIDGFDLQWQTSKALVEVTDNDATKLLEVLNNRIDNPTKDLEYAGSFTNKNSKIVEAVWRAFAEEYPGCIPVEYSYNLNSMQRKYKGFKGVTADRDFRLLSLSNGYKEALELLEVRPPADSPDEFLQKFLDKHLAIMPESFEQIFIEELMLEARNWKLIE